MGTPRDLAACRVSLLSPDPASHRIISASSCTANCLAVMAKVMDDAFGIRYGLATAIFTQDIGRANRVAQRIHVGLTWINCWFLRDLRTSFGGSKASGIGREGGVHSFEFYTDLRNVMVKF